MQYVNTVPFLLQVWQVPQMRKQLSKQHIEKINSQFVQKIHTYANYQRSDSLFISTSNCYLGGGSMDSNELRVCLYKDH